MAQPKVGILGQASPDPTTNATIYTGPSNRRAVSSTLVVCETGGADTTFRVHVGIAGAAATTSNAIAYDVILPANSLYSLTFGMAFAATDKVYVYSDSGDVTFTMFGEETDVPS